MLDNNEWVRANPYFTRGAEALARELEQAGSPAPQFVNFSAGNIAALLPSRFTHWQALFTLTTEFSL